MKEILYDWGGLNAWLFKLINGLYISGDESFWLFLTALGDHKNFKYYTGLVGAYLIGEMIYRKLDKKPIERRHLNEAAALLITLVMGYMAYGFITGILKSFFYMPRPFMIPDIRAHMHYAGPYPSQADYYASFPSGHAATIAFLVAALWYKFRNRYVHYAGIALVVLVCWSRIAVGMHFPADVLIGAAIGVFIAYFVREYVYRMMRVPLPTPAFFAKMIPPHVAPPPVAVHPPQAARPPAAAASGARKP